MGVKINFEDEIKKLRPVTWIYKDDPSETRNIGYIAEELDAIDAFKYLVYYDDEKLPAGIKYELLSVYAIEAIKIAYQKIDKLEKRLSELESSR